MKFPGHHLFQKGKEFIFGANNTATPVVESLALPFHELTIEALAAEMAHVESKYDLAGVRVPANHHALILGNRLGCGRTVTVGQMLPSIRGAKVIILDRRSELTANSCLTTDIALDVDAPGDFSLAKWIMNQTPGFLFVTSKNRDKAALSDFINTAGQLVLERGLGGDVFFVLDSYDAIPPVAVLPTLVKDGKAMNVHVIIATQVLEGALATQADAFGTFMVIGPHVLHAERDFLYKRFTGKALQRVESVAEWKEANAKGANLTVDDLLYSTARNSPVWLNPLKKMDFYLLIRGHDPARGKLKIPVS